MYFQIENTPEHIRRSRHVEKKQNQSPKEKCPRLILAPFSRPPLVIFENVLIGTSCERNLEVFNPTKQVQQITLVKNLPPDLEILIPDALVVEPETCYCLTMLWTPMQPTALRETIRFTNENRGRYDVTVVLKSVLMQTKGKAPRKVFKTSPGKIKRKPTKTSPVSIYKKKSKIIYNTTKVMETVKVVQSHHRVLQPSNRDIGHCPFDSPTSIDFNFDTSEIFSNMRKTNILQQTYDKSCMENKENLIQPQNTKKQTDKHNASDVDIFKNLTFTPLKSQPTKSDKLDKGPKIILSVNSESDFNDSLDMKTSDKENETHSVISVMSSQPNKWLTIDQHNNLRIDNQQLETPTVQNKKIPNTSSPKELNSPNFSINTEFSRISDLSFFPQRFSTERKEFPRYNNDTHDIIDDMHVKPSSDTFTKDSPLTSLENFHMESKYPPFFMRDQHPKMCRQSLFKEMQQPRAFNDRHYLNPYYEHNIWQNDVKSPPRSLTPPLQSIPEESHQHSESQTLDRTDKQMTTFTISDRTFNKDRTILSNCKQSWSKTAVVKTEPELWKVPVPLPKKMKSRTSTQNSQYNATFDGDKSVGQNISISNLGNVYSQSLTVDPFLSSTYFYDEEAVDKLEKEFKKWLNCILTPPADLDSNIEQKIDLGKAWIENRNKDVPAAPTKEQVCSNYHNNHRLESLRRAAKSLLMSPEIVQVLQKTNLQIDKKLIAIRTDKNLHLDIGLQKIIMELLLSYNPLWLRIGLEAIYGLVLPLKSNSDIDGLTTFIIQRLFKNPHLKNKHSKSNAPNMLRPAYMEAIKKFTLKKFFMLVFFLDQAKQKKLISHDPCLFCRNAVCKESREIIIRFTRELIAGIGDITKHLRPLGYVVCHKQSYLNEYKYAVHNLATDIRDGVRLTKVMEIILIKNGLLNQLRTPAISRLQKIHNVQVALTALKDANFVINGDITANDIADGHREKTLSLLWQLIHEFRAPLFEKAANVIQTWWRKKYEVIVEKRKEEERILKTRIDAASVIQCWWRRILYSRVVEWKMQQLTTATVTLQKYCRMWLCRTRFRILKVSVIKIEEWYRSVKLMREARLILNKLKSEKEELRHKSATVLQSYVRRWICMKEYRKRIKQIILIQSLVRRFILRQQFVRLLTTIIYVQQKYRSKLQMKAEMLNLAEKRKSTIIIQSVFRMVKQRKVYLELKRSARIIAERYQALLLMRKERNNYLKLKRSAIWLQTLYRGRRCRLQYTRQRNQIIYLQRKIRAHQLMTNVKCHYLKTKQAVVIIQTYMKSYLVMKKIRKDYIAKRDSAIVIQKYFRSYLIAKSQRKRYVQIRRAAVCIQNYYRSLIKMRQAKSTFNQLKNAAIAIQRRYRALILMRHCKENYKKNVAACVTIQRRFRAQKMMSRDRKDYIHVRNSCIKIQNAFKAYILGKKQRENYLKNRESAIKIQRWFRNCRKGKQVMQEYQESKQACIVIQRIYKAYIVGKKQRQEYIRIKTATICIQKYYRAYIEMKTVRQHFIQLKTSTVTIQRFYRSHLEVKKQRKAFVNIKTAASFIQNYFRQYRKTKEIRQKYCDLRKACVCIQRRFRSILLMRRERELYLKLRTCTLVIQQRYKAMLAMRTERQTYLKLRSAAMVIQTRYRAQCLMKQERANYDRVLKACISIQRFIRAYNIGSKERARYLIIKQSTIVLQQRYRALLAMRKQKQIYEKTRLSVLIIQRKYRAHCLMLKDRSHYMTLRQACITIQRKYKACLIGKKHRNEYVNMKSAAIVIQKHFRLRRETKIIRTQYERLRNYVVFIQRLFRANKVTRENRRHEAATKIKSWYLAVLQGKNCRAEYNKLRNCTILIQSTWRMYIARKKYLLIKKAVCTIERHYLSYKLTKETRRKYINDRSSLIKLQAFVKGYMARKQYTRIRAAALTIQAAYRMKVQKDVERTVRYNAAVTIQKNIKRYIVRSRYLEYRSKVILVQKLWRGKLVTRLMRCEFLQKREFIIKIQTVIRGYLVRREVQFKKEYLEKVREENRRNWAASKIQACYRGYKTRVRVDSNPGAAELRRRWREGALKSTQQTLNERNKDAMDVLRNRSDIESVIRAFKSLEILTEVFPMMYQNNASSIVRRVYVYMGVTNRSISSIEVLKSAASILVNLTRYKITGPKIYARDRISPVLKFMWRFNNTETQLFCILATYLWLFAKYDEVREDLTEFLHIPENHKMLTAIKGNVARMKRMAINIRMKFNTPQPSKFKSLTGNQSLNYSVCSNPNNYGIPLPALEADYGITRADKPRYFEDAQFAIDSLFTAYKL